MAFSKLTRIILYVVAGISLVVVLFFYAAPKTVDYDELEMKVEGILNPVDMDMQAALPVVDSTEADSSTVEDVVSEAVEEKVSAAGEEMDTIEEVMEVVEPVAVEISDQSDTGKPNLKEQLSGWEYLVWFRTDIALIWAYILLLITAIAAIVFPLIAVISNPKALIRLLAVLVGAAALVVIAYLLSSDTPIDIVGYTGTDNSDPGTLKIIDTVLFGTYMLFGLAIASILYAIISKAFK